MSWRALIDWDWQGTVGVLCVAAVVAGVLFAGARRRAAGVVMILALGFLGGSLALPEEDDRGLSWRRRHLKVVRVQLAELADRLRSYKARHGRYPTNDEHLGVLDDFEVRFAAPIDQSANGQPKYRYSGWQGIWSNPGRWASVLRSNARGSLASQQEAAEVLGLTAEMPGDEIAVGKRETLMMFRDGMACSPWGIPYVYENGEGLPSGVFEHSPAKSDSRGLYSVKVDEGVYLWSVGGQFMAEELAAGEWRRLIPRLVGGILITAAFVIVLWWAVKRYRGFRILGWAAFLLSVSAGAAENLLSSFVTCYIMSPLFYRRDPQTLVIQQQLLAKYRDAGVITDATYQRAINAANQTPAGGPPAGPAATSQATTQATQPAEGR